MITKEEFVAAAERNAANLADLPVTSAIFRYLASELKKGDPRWWTKTLEAWKDRRFVQWAEATNLFLTCLHFEALDDAKHALVPYFPSCGGTAEADPSTALAKFLKDPPAKFFEHLRSGERRYYSEAAGALWRNAAWHSFEERGLPYHLVQINAGAGLNLLADILIPDPKRFDSDLVEARVGFDPAPLIVDEIAQLRWLTAAIYPDQGPAIQKLDNAIEALRKSRGRDAAVVQLVKCAAALAPKYIAKNIPTDDPDVGLLVFNYMATSRMDEEEYKVFCGEMLAMLKPWGDRGLWLEIENVRGEMFSLTLQFRLHRVVEGILATHEMGRADFAAKKDTFDRKGTEKFLSVAKPARGK